MGKIKAVTTKTVSIKVSTMASLTITKVHRIIAHNIGPIQVLLVFTFYAFLRSTPYSLTVDRNADSVLTSACIPWPAPTTGLTRLL